MHRSARGNVKRTTTTQQHQQGGMAVCAPMMPSQQQPAAMGPLHRHQGASLCVQGSLQFSLEVEEDKSTQAFSTAGARIHSHENALAFCKFASNPEGLFCAQLVLDVRRLARQLQSEAADGSSVDVVELGSRLCAMGYRITVRTALGGGPACFRNLRHEFLTVLGEGDYRDVPYFVDPAFKEQFEIPSPTPSYADLLDQLPSEFVGTSSRLVPLVQNLCAEMVASFEANNLTLPPWRRAQSMLTKWLPSKSRDVAISVNTDPGAGGSSSSTGACCSGHSPGSSPVAADAEAASGSSPFSRIEDHQICRQGSGRSLLSGKLGSAGSNRCLGRSNSSSSASSSSMMQYAAPASSTKASSGASTQSAQQLLQLHQQARQLLQQQQPHQQQLVVGGGAISRQPSLYQGQPATYTVKMGALPPATQQRQQ